MEPISKHFHGFPSGAANLSVGITFLVIISGGKLVDGSLIGSLSNNQDQYLRASGFLVLGLIAYVIGAVFHIICSSITQHFDENNIERYKFLLNDASERQYSEFLAIETKSQIILTFLFSLTWGFFFSVEFALNGYETATWPVAVFKILFGGLLLWGFCKFSKGYANLIFRQFDDVIGIKTK